MFWWVTWLGLHSALFCQMLIGSWCVPGSPVARWGPEKPSQSLPVGEALCQGPWECQACEAMTREMGFRLRNWWGLQAGTASWGPSLYNETWRLHWNWLDESMGEGVGSFRTFQVEGKTCTEVLRRGGTLTVGEAAGLEGTGRVAWGGSGEDLAFYPDHCENSLSGLACVKMLAVGMVTVDRFGGDRNRTCWQIRCWRWGRRGDSKVAWWRMWFTEPGTLEGSRRWVEELSLFYF